jgi:hypothetical protein
MAAPIRISHNRNVQWPADKPEKKGGGKRGVKMLKAQKKGSKTPKPTKK